MLFGVYVGSSIACLAINIVVIKNLERKLSNAGYRIVKEKRLIKKDAEDVVSSFLPFINLVVAFFELRTLVDNDVFCDFLKNAVKCGAIEKVSDSKNYNFDDKIESDYDIPLYSYRMPANISRPLVRVKKR